MKIPKYTIRDIDSQYTPTSVPWNLDLVRAPSFWTKNKGGGTVVAVIDTGLDVNHSEFAGRIFKPYSFLSRNDNVIDIEGHGTHVAGIIAGKTCGVAPEARIMPLKVFGDNNVGLHIQDALIRILDHNRVAADKDKVRVVNCSFSGGFYDYMTAYLIRRLVNDGVSVVVSAGNAGDGNVETEEIFSYPAYIWECVTVGATNRDGKVAGYSNSFDGIDIGAPGTDVYSAWPGGGYKILSGTSMSAPHVTGALALINAAWYDREGKWPTEDEAFEVLMKHVRKVSDLDRRFVGEGILNLSWDNRRWPLWRVQLGAFYYKEGMETLTKTAKQTGLDTYPVKY